MLLTKYDAAIADFQRMRQLARASGQPRQEGESLCHLAFAHYRSSRTTSSRWSNTTPRRRSTWRNALGIQTSWPGASPALGLVAVSAGNMQEAERQLAASLQISRREGYNDALAPTLRILSCASLLAGAFSARHPLCPGGCDALPVTSMMAFMSCTVSRFCASPAGVRATIPRRSASRTRS